VTSEAHGSPARMLLLLALVTVLGVAAFVWWFFGRSTRADKLDAPAVAAVDVVPPFDPVASMEAWDSLSARPLSLPSADTGACPASATSVVDDREAAGQGPIYAIVDPSRVVVVTEPDANVWRSQKVLWLSANRYAGPAMVRGHQLDGPGEIMFESAANGNRSRMDALLISAGSTGVSSGANDWRQGVRWVPSALFFTNPGCYALHVDGPSFQYVIVLRVSFDS
jgi:hypothetical protein